MRCLGCTDQNPEHAKFAPGAAHSSEAMIRVDCRAHPAAGERGLFEGAAKRPPSKSRTRWGRNAREFQNSNAVARIDSPSPCSKVPKSLSP
jgi:hypothetical protein